MLRRRRSSFRRSTTCLFAGWLSWIAVAFVVSFTAPSLEAAGNRRPNILFLFCDDHAYQAISAYQEVSAYHLKLNRTPNIDRLAREGVRFDNCFVTNSICGPSRAVIQTGKYSHLNGFFCNGDKFDGYQQTFPKLLQKVGYQTAIIGKWHLGTHMAPQGYNYSEVLIGQGPYYNPPMLRDANGDGQRERVKYIGYTTDIITDLALDWLQKKRDPNKPFLLMVQHKAPHRNWQPGPKYLHLYDDVTIPEPDTLFDDYSGRGTPAKTQDMTIAQTMTPFDLKLTPPRNLTPEQLKVWNAAYEPKNEAFRKANLKGKDLVRWKYQRYMKDYLRCIASVDENVGRLLDYLDRTGLAANTVVIYSSDQGFYLGEHGWFDKRWIYEESLRTPLLVRWPGVAKPGTVNKDLVSNLDFAETFLDIAGAPIPSDMQGRSLVPLLKGRTPTDWRKSFYYHYYEFPGAHHVRRHYGVVDGRYKLIHFYEPDVNEWELYDLQQDPKELRSVYGEPEYARIQDRLLAELKRLRKELKVPDPDPPQSYRGGMQRYQRALEKAKQRRKELGLD
ncbi:MAG: sulfatase [Planctomycetes bacterium]|nr:sulfatase [Planctomycetota bacterium]